MGIFKIKGWVDLFGLCKENLAKAAVTIMLPPLFFCLDKVTKAVDPHYLDGNEATVFYAISLMKYIIVHSACCWLPQPNLNGTIDTKVVPFFCTHKMPKIRTFCYEKKHLKNGFPFLWRAENKQRNE